MAWPPSRSADTGDLSAAVGCDHTGVMAEPSTAPDDGVSGEAIPLPTPRPRPNGSVLMAAMLGLANALGMEPKDEPSEMVQAADPLDDDVDLDFGSLRPLDE